MTKWQRARLVVRQLNDNEWKFKWNDISNRALTAKRCGMELWVGTAGSWFTDLYPKKNAFGLLGRHYVYWFGARKAQRKFERECCEIDDAELLKEVS